MNVGNAGAVENMAGFKVVNMSREAIVVRSSCAKACNLKALKTAIVPSKKSLIPRECETSISLFMSLLHKLSPENIDKITMEEVEVLVQITRSKENWYRPILMMVFAFHSGSMEYMVKKVLETGIIGGKIKEISEMDIDEPVLTNQIVPVAIDLNAMIFGFGTLINKLLVGNIANVTSEELQTLVEIFEWRVNFLWLIGRHHNNEFINDYAIRFAYLHSQSKSYYLE